MNNILMHFLPVFFFSTSMYMCGTSLAIQWLGLCASSAGDVGPIPNQGGTKIPHAKRHNQKLLFKKKKNIYIYVYIHICRCMCVLATHSSILAWRIPWTEEPGRLQCLGS